MSIQSFYYPKLTTLPDAWKRSSFTEISALWILSNHSLTLSDCKIRKIKDLGTIKDSLISSRLDLFDRQIDRHFGLNKALERAASALMRAVALLGVFVFAAPIGVIWHLGNCVYHTILWIRRESPIHVKQHINSFFYDLVWSISIYSIFALKLIGRKHINKLNLLPIPLIIAGALFCELFVKPSLILLTGLFPELLNMFIGSSVSLTLKRQFGLVGEDGWLLTFNQAVDAPTVKEGKTANHVVLSGYFCDLLEEQATNALLKFRQIIDLLKLELKEEELKTFSKNPEKFLLYLHNLTDKLEGEALCDRVQLSQFIAKADRAFENFNLIRGLLSELLPSHIRLAPFPFSPKMCRNYFTYQYERNQTAQQLFDHFKDLLTEIKEVSLLEGGPNDSFIKIKQSILDANNAYEVLGLKAGASKKACKKAYIKSVIQIHPDKTPEIWKAQAAKLFTVVHTAYKYISSV